jgi:hypothetical protein
MNSKQRNYYKIRNYLENLKEVNIQISDQNGIWEDKLPKGELQLSFFSDEEIKDFQVLNLLLDLFKQMLDELFEMNSINYKQAFS